MIEKIALRVFWVFMLFCAGTALTSIWFQNSIDMRFIPTFFIIGFASFLIWTPTMVYKFYEKLK